MLKLTLFALVLAGFSGYASTDLTELKDTKCAYFENQNDDPRLAIEFSEVADLSDFVHVTISKRMTDSDESWKVISESDEQIMINDHYYSMGIDDLVILIKRPVPGWNKLKGRKNGSLEYRDKGVTYALTCENIKK